MVSIQSYGQKSPQWNCMVVTIGLLKLYFSYKTIVAFSDGGQFYCSENVWSRTTGKHLGYISEKKDRIPNEDFNMLLNHTLQRHGL